MAPRASKKKASKDAPYKVSMSGSALRSAIVDFKYLAAMHFQCDLQLALASLSKCFQADLLENSFADVTHRVTDFLTLRTGSIIDSNFLSTLRCGSGLTLLTHSASTLVPLSTLG